MKKILIALFVVVCAASCKSAYQTVLESGDAETKYAMAMKLFDEGKYTKSSQLFESLSLASSGTEREDTVQYYWGLSNYRLKDFSTAKTNFETFLQNFPSSPFSSYADYYRIDCMYRDTYRYTLDQTPTYAAIAAISQYMIEHPTSMYYGSCQKMLDDLEERLDHKAYEAALLYYKMEDYKAAGVAFRNVLKEDSKNIYREEILYYTAMSSYKYANMSVTSKQKERYMKFQDDYYNFVSEYPESKYRSDLDKLFAKVKEKK